MLINEVCQKCSLTKKAVAYYVEQGLVSPAVQQNGYRCFSEKDIARLKKISVLRSLGLSVADIHAVLSGQTAETQSNGCQASPAILMLNKIANKQRLEITALQEKQKLLQELAQNHDWEQAQNRLQQLEKKQSVLKRLLNVFPGYYGRFISLHFAPYLNEPIITDEQQEAFHTVISFLDNAQFNIPGDLQKLLDESAARLDETAVENLAADTTKLIQDTKGYLAEHREILEHYMSFKQSNEYKASPAYRLEKALKQFASASGYNDIFIPAMCRLSSSYRKYLEELQKANEQFLQEYPQYE